MLSACASSIARAASARTLLSSHQRLLQASSSAAVSSIHLRTVTSEVGDRTAEHAWNKSCYSGIDYTISDDATVYDMVEKLVAHDVGCLVTKDAEGKTLLEGRLKI